MQPLLLLASGAPELLGFRVLGSPGAWGSSSEAAPMDVLAAAELASPRCPWSDPATIGRNTFASRTAAASAHCLGTTPRRRWSDASAEKEAALKRPPASSYPGGIFSVRLWTLLRLLEALLYVQPPLPGIWADRVPHRHRSRSATVHPAGRLLSHLVRGTLRAGAPHPCQAERLELMGHRPFVWRRCTY